MAAARPPRRAARAPAYMSDLLMAAGINATLAATPRIAHLATSLAAPQQRSAPQPGGTLGC